MMNEQTFRALRRNDPTVREVHRSFRSTRRPGWSTAAALSGNTHVQSLVFHFESSYYGPGVGTPQAEEEERLRTFIRTSSSLRSVKYSFGCGSKYVGVWVDAVAANSNIDELELIYYTTMTNIGSGQRPTVANAFCRLLHTTTHSIKHARIAVGDRIGDIGDALRTNATLESFSIDECSTMSILTVLNALHGHGSIRCVGLGLCQWETTKITSRLVMESLSTLLRSSSILTELSLGRFGFDSERTEQFINDLDSNRSITKLALSMCRFSNAAAQTRFIAYMQQRNGRFDEGRLQADFGDKQRAEDYSTDDFLARIVNAPHRQGLAVTFSHSVFATFWGFLDEATKSPDCLLSHLRLNDRDLDMLQLESVVRLIPKLKYLCTIEWKTQNEARTLLLDAFRKSGSLYSVVVRDRFGEEIIWNPNEERLVKAWGERNRHLPELLSHCGTQSKDEPSTGNENEAATDVMSHPASTNALSSTLFAVALETPHMALHHFFHGITDMGDGLVGSSSSHCTSSIRIHSQEQAVAGNEEGQSNRKRGGP